MKRIAGLFLLALCSAALMYAQNSSTPKEMNGTICDAECVTHSAMGNATCDPGCTIKGDRAVFVGDDGSVMQVQNQDICKSHMGKHVKMTYDPVGHATEKQREQMIRIRDLQNLNEAGG
jgi:hypothetical protein